MTTSRHATSAGVPPVVSERPKGNSFLRLYYRAVWLTVGVVYLLCLITVAGIFVQAGLPGAPSFIASVLILWATYIGLVVVHEAGHAVVAWLSGWQVAVISLFGLTIWPHPFRVHLGARAFGLTGAVLAVPPTRSQLRSAYCAMVFGGAAGNFLLALLVALGANLVTDVGPYRYLNVVAVLSVLTGVLNLLPFRNEIGGSSDGLMLLRALQGEDISFYPWECRFGAEVAARKPAADWDPDVVAMVSANTSPKNAATVGAMGYAIALSRGDLESAKMALSLFPANADANGIGIERAFMLAYADHDPKAALSILEKISWRRAKRSPAYWRAMGTTQALLGDSAEARRCFALARNELKRFPFSTSDDYRLLSRVEAELPPFSAGTA